jgi:cyclophilin family peptidyl-prolyl cis-trans isomerase
LTLFFKERFVKRLLLLPVMMWAFMAASCPETPTNPIVEIDTSMGKITVELDQQKVPDTVANFLAYVDAKHYDGTVFHRVIPDFMIQGGGFKTGMQNAKNEKDFTILEKPTKDPIKLEVNKGLSNTRGTIAMARTNRKNSATSQFFINTVDNAGKLDPNSQSDGYAVFGKVIEGMEVVDKIRNVKTHAIIPEAIEDVPVEDVVILSIRRKP